MRRFFIQGLLIAALVALVGVGFLAWIGSEGGLTPVKPATPNAEGIQDVYVFIGAFLTLVFLVVTVPLALFVVRFRRGSRDPNEEGPQITGHTRLELTWTAIPVLILVAIATFTAFKLSGIKNAPAAGGAPRLQIDVGGHQFYWRFVYPNGAIAYDTLRLPVDTSVRVNVTAPEGDVIHSFWFPALTGKVDAIPGKRTHLEFRPTKTGTFEGKCAELCGIQHGAMLMTAEVMPKEEFERWLDSAPGRGDLGKEIFETVCSKCHFAAPEFAPNIAGNPILADAKALTALVRNGRRRMPAVGRTWTDAEIDALVEYAKQLGGGGTGGG